MWILQPLRQGPIARLWLGQSLATIGEQLYKIALAWLSVGLIGSSTGFVLASECVGVLLVALLVGPLSDGLDARRTMTGADCLRAVLALAPVLAALSDRLSMATLVIPSILLASLRPVFDPALQASLPRLARERSLLVGTNALMDATTRIGRLAGPSLAGVLAMMLPTFGLMLVTCACFVVSGIAVMSLRRALPPQAHPVARSTPLRSLAAGFRAARSRPGFVFLLWTGAIINGLWIVAMWLALPLALHRAQAGDTAFSGLALVSFAMAAYGAGNLSSSLVVGNIPAHRPALWIIAGQAIIAAGFMLLGALSDHLAGGVAFKAFATAAFIAGMGAPLSDITMATLRQTIFPLDEIAVVFRLKMIFDWSGMLIANLAAPLVLHCIGPGMLIVVCGAGIGLVALVGLLLPSFRSIGTGEPLVASAWRTNQPGAVNT